MCMYICLSIYMYLCIFMVACRDVLEYVCMCVVHNLHVRSSVSSISGSNVSGALSVETY